MCLGLRFGWFSKHPDFNDDQCLWMNVKETRTLLGEEEFDQALLKHLTIITDSPEEAYPNINAVWSKFGKVFSALFSLLSYAPLVKEYFYEGFKEFKEDNNQYLEFRTVLPRLCPSMEFCEPNEATSQLETAKVFKEAADKFLQVTF